MMARRSPAVPPTPAASRVRPARAVRHPTARSGTRPARAAWRGLARPAPGRQNIAFVSCGLAGQAESRSPAIRHPAGLARAGQAPARADCGVAWVAASRIAGQPAAGPGPGPGAQIKGARGYETRAKQHRPSARPGSFSGFSPPGIAAGPQPLACASRPGEGHGGY